MGKKLLEILEGILFIVLQIFLIILFYTLFLSIGSIMKLLRYDPMKRKFYPDQDTYRIVYKRIF